MLRAITDWNTKPKKKWKANINPIYPYARPLLKMNWFVPLPALKYSFTKTTSFYETLSNPILINFRKCFVEVWSALPTRGRPPSRLSLLSLVMELVRNWWLPSRLKTISFLIIFFQEVFTSASVPVQFEEVGLTGVNTKEGAYEEAIASISKNGICLMGALENAQAAGLQQSMNFQLRNDLGVFGNVAHIKSIEGLQSKFSNVDIVAIRETAEGEYKCLEHEPVPGVVEALKITTNENSDRIHKVIFLVLLFYLWI